MPERVMLCIGTKKGLFVAEAPKTRRRFALRGPFGPGVAVHAALIDTRGTPRLYASSCNAFSGMKVLRSTDLGKTFRETKSAPAFPKDDGRALANIWSLEAGDHKQRLWCGVEPAALFRSSDGGDSWAMVPGISNHEHARQRQPGNGGLCLHTVLRGGHRVHLGISTGGHYLSADGGGAWQRLARGLPRKESFFTVQRDALAIDELTSSALSFGTTTGQLWLGRDGGEGWSRLFDSLPPIHCVKAAVV
jgi:photosystem II stability/assembly factor-like uncharacterized protein